MTAPRHADPTAEAIKFLAQPGHAERVLVGHHDRGDGRCAGCVAQPSAWPCSVAALAQKAVAGRAAT